MRRRKQIKAATMLQIGIAGVFLIVLVLILVWYSDGLNSFQPDEGTYQFIAGTKVEHTTKATYRDKDGVIEISDLSGKSNVLYKLREFQRKKYSLTRTDKTFKPLSELRKLSF